jgi:hypothetical protein
MADKRKKPREQIKLDRIMRLLFHLSHKTVVLLINGLFDEAFDPGQVKVVYGNGNMTGHDFSKLEADLLLKVEIHPGTGGAGACFSRRTNYSVPGACYAVLDEYSPGLNREEAVRLASPSSFPLAQTAAGLGAEQIAGRRKAAADG